VSGVFWVVVEPSDGELPALDANLPLTVTHGNLATVTAVNLHISQSGQSVHVGLQHVVRARAVRLQPLKPVE